jgi:hypothetical protein
MVNKYRKKEKKRRDTPEKTKIYRIENYMKIAVDSKGEVGFKTLKKCRTRVTIN